MASPIRSPRRTSIITLLILACIWLHSESAEAAHDKYIGINYGRLANNLPPVEQAVQLILQSTTIRKVKLFDADPSVLRALAGTGIEVMITFPDDQIYPAGRRQLNAFRWVRQNVMPFVRAGTRVTSICVGNEVLINVQPATRRTAQQLGPALWNIQAALDHYKLRGVQVSTPHALNLLNPSFPPSTGTFRADLLPYLRPVLQFLNVTGAPLMINAYPYFAYRNDPRGVPLDYALFKSNHGMLDNRTGLHYSNLLDAQVDSLYAAMDNVGFHGVRIVVTETGWPSAPSSELGATPGNAAAYNGGLVRHLRSLKGTPLRPKVPLEAYIFALFDENAKVGPESEHHYGIFHADSTISYNIGVQKQGGGGSSSSPQTAWCVAKSDSGNAALQAALDWACGPGKADCSAIQPGQACYNPNTLVAHASYAFNSYFQRNGRKGEDCNFGGTAQVTHANPSYQGCSYAA